MTQDRGPLVSRRCFLGALGAAATLAALPEHARAQTVLANRRLEIWFARHAESEINLPNAPRPVLDQGMSYPLTAKGMQQAKALGVTLADAPLLAVYTSTQLRAVQTADAVALEHGLSVTLAPEAVEINLDLDPDQSPREPFTELTRKWLAEKDLDARHRNGESFADVQRRFLPFVRELMNRHGLDAGVVLIISHSATLGLMTPVLATNVPPDFLLRYPLPHTGLIKTELRDSRLFCTEWPGAPVGSIARAA